MVGLKNGILFPLGGLRHEAMFRAQTFILDTLCPVPPSLLETTILMTPGAALWTSIIFKADSSVSVSRRLFLMSF